MMSSEVNNKTLQQMTNSMKGKWAVDLPPYRESEENYSTTIRVVKRIETEDTKEVQIHAQHYGETEQDVEIFARGVGERSKKASIRLPHSNCMGIRYATEEPEKIIEPIEADMDTYTKEEVPFNIDNFGDSNTLLVSGTVGEHRNSLLYFELPLWLLPVVSISTKLRLYYRGSIKDNQELLLSTANRTWGEYSATFANSPHRDKQITREFTINRRERYIEFDVTNIIDYWKRFPEENFGFILENLEENKVSFFSRESQQKPLLVAEYYDPTIKTVGRSTKHTQIKVVHNRDTDKDVTIEALTFNRELDKDTKIQVYQHGELIPNDKDVKLVVTKPQTPVFLANSEDRDRDKEVIIAVRTPHASHSEAQIMVTNPFKFVEIDVVYSSDKDVELWVDPNNDVEVIIDIGKVSDKEVVLENLSSSSKHTQITVTREQLDTEIYVLSTSGMPVQIAARKPVIHGHNTMIVATKRTKGVIIDIPIMLNSDKEVNISAKGWEHSEKETQLSVTRDTVGVELVSHKAWEDVDAQIYVANRTDYEVVIENTDASNQEVIVNVFDTDTKLVELTVTKPETPVLLGVYYDKNSEPIVEIRPVIRRTSNKAVAISVKYDNLAYAFIM